MPAGLELQLQSLDRMILKDKTVLITGGTGSFGSQA